MTTTATYEFDAAFQDKIVAHALRDHVFMERSGDLLEAGYFEDTASAFLVDTAVKYHRRYAGVPSLPVLSNMIKKRVAAKEISDDELQDVKAKLKVVMPAKLTDREFLVEEVSSFAKHQAITDALLASADMLDKRDFAKIEEKLKSALAVGDTDFGGVIDYFDDVEDRTAQRKAMAAGLATVKGITTGIPALDREMRAGGWGRNELSVIMGKAKAGKTFALINFALNAALAGKNVLYVSLEVSNEIIAERSDANVGDTEIKELVNNPASVEAKVKAKSSKAGIFKIADYPSGSLSPSQLRRIIHKYASRGIHFDMVALDYADLMKSDTQYNERRDQLNEIYVTLRAISQEFNLAMLTATQSNREGARQATAKAEDVAEDYNKVRTADIFLTLNFTEEERENNEARIFFAASRTGESGFSIRVQQDFSKGRFITRIMGKE